MIDAWRIGVGVATPTSQVADTFGQKLLESGDAEDAAIGKFEKLKSAATDAMKGIAAANTFLSYGDKLRERQRRLAELGVSPANVDRATRAAIDYATSIPGTDPAQDLASIRELWKSLGDTRQAIAAAPALIGFGACIVATPHSTPHAAPRPEMRPRCSAQLKLR